MKPSQAAKPRKSRATLIVLFAVAVVFIAVIWFISSLILGEKINTVGKSDFANTLPIPKLAASSVNADGTRVFTLNAQAGTTDFFAGKPTDTWGYNGAVLGPTLRAKVGEKVRVNITNNLNEVTSVHWHGMHLPAKMDGGPHQPIEPGATWSPEWTIKQSAATLWYHPHPHGETEQHVYKGLAGMFIIDDPENTPAGLPSSYGVDDIPVIVQDKRFNADKQLITGDEMPTGNLGDTIIVNGAVTPHVDVTSELVRLRLLNGSTARIYNFGFSDNRAMQIIASDGGLLEKPVSKDRLLLSPGERAEIVVAMKPNEQTTLRSFPVDLGAGIFVQRQIGAEDTLDIMQLRASQTLKASAQLPETLASLPKPDETTAIKTRDFLLNSKKTINQKSMDMSRIDFSVQKDTSEIWTVTNRGGSPHSFHIHDVQYRILSINGKTPPPELSGQKDTVLLQEGQTARLLVHFADFSDPTMPYMYHCHLIRHEDLGMMGQFVVTDEPATDTPTTLPDMSGMNHMSH